MYLILLGLFLIFTPVYAESIPDYEKPYAPIFTDKSVYSWTDKIIISVMAPSWNSNPNQINSIGHLESHSIKISSGEYSLKPYRLTETNSNSAPDKFSELETIAKPGTAHGVIAADKLHSPLKTA